jgi:hypothetical protein
MTGFADDLPIKADFPPKNAQLFAESALDQTRQLPIDSLAMLENIRQAALLVVVVGNDAVGACR